MNTSPQSANLSTPPRWVGALLGIAMVAAGALVLGDVVLFTVVSAIFIGSVAIVIGAFEIAHAFWTKDGGGLIWKVVLGILYVAFGIVLVTQPVAGALFVTYILGLALLVSGIIRFAIGTANWQRGGWVMVASGIFGLAAGIIILTGFPRSGLWVLALLLSVDLLSHGFGWIMYTWRS